MIRSLITMSSVCLLLILFSCKQSEINSEAPRDFTIQENIETETKELPDETEADRKLVKDGNITFKTSDVNKTKTYITQLVQEFKGYIAKDNVSDYSGRIEHHLLIRVPSSNFDLLLTKISESADKVESKNVDVVDVTKEYIDLEARIKTKKELLSRYNELIKQSSKVDEILNIEKELNSLQADIESVEGQMKYLKDKISLSTLDVTYYEEKSTSFEFLSKFSNALKDGWSVFLWFVVGVTQLWVFLAIGVIVVFLIKRRRSKHKHKIP